MVMYTVVYTKKAVKDIELLKAAKLDNKAKRLIEIIKNNPFEKYPPYEKLVGDLKGLYSRRISVQRRLIYSVNEETKVIKIIAMWTHYE